LVKDVIPSLENPPLQGINVFSSRLPLHTNNSILNSLTITLCCVSMAGLSIKYLAKSQKVQFALENG